MLTDGSTSLELKNILCVPEIAKNLVSVSKLAQDNSVFIEFHDDFCLVKDKCTGQTMLKGVLKDDLYQLEGVQTTLGAKTNERKMNKLATEGNFVSSDSPFVFVLSDKTSI